MVNDSWGVVNYHTHAIHCLRICLMWMLPLAVRIWKSIAFLYNRVEQTIEWVIWWICRHFNEIIEIIMKNKDPFTLHSHQRPSYRLSFPSFRTRMVNNNDVTYRDIHHLTQLHTLQLRRKTAQQIKVAWGADILCLPVPNVSAYRPIGYMAGSWSWYIRYVNMINSINGRRQLLATSFERIRYGS